MRFGLKTLLLLTGLIAIGLTIFLTIQNHNRITRQRALKILTSYDTILLQHAGEPAPYAEIWVSQLPSGSFEVNGNEYSEEGARALLLNLRLTLDQLGFDRMVYIDSEPGTRSGRLSTTKLVYGAGIISVGDQGTSTFSQRRKLVESKK